MTPSTTPSPPTAIGRAGGDPARTGADHLDQLQQVWLASWREAMKSVLYVELLPSSAAANRLSDLQHYASTPSAATQDGCGRAYGWRGGVVFTGVLADERECLSLVVHAVDRHVRPDLRLDEIGDGWVRDETGWLAFRTGIQLSATLAELEPLQAAALNIAAQIMWVSGRRRRWAAGSDRLPRFSRLAGAWVGIGA